MSNNFGNVLSGEATLTIEKAPSIREHPREAVVGVGQTADPSDVTANLGDTATFSAQAGGSEPINYQWQRSRDGVSFTDIARADENTFVIAATADTDHNTYYRCVARNEFGEDVSNAALLTLRLAPRITSHPRNIAVSLGDRARFNVQADGSGPLSYQWERSPDGVTFVPMEGSTRRIYVLGAAASGDHNARFRCVVRNELGTETSNAALLIVRQPPVITSQPPDIEALQGQFAEFRVVAAGGSLSYRWQTAAAGSTEFVDIPAQSRRSINLSPHFRITARSIDASFPTPMEALTATWRSFACEAAKRLAKGEAIRLLFLRTRRSSAKGMNSFNSPA